MCECECECECTCECECRCAFGELGLGAIHASVACIFLASSSVMPPIGMVAYTATSPPRLAKWCDASASDGDPGPAGDVGVGMR